MSCHIFVNFRVNVLQSYLLFLLLANAPIAFATTALIGGTYLPRGSVDTLPSPHAFGAKNDSVYVFFRASGFLEGATPTPGTFKPTTSNPGQSEHTYLIRYSRDLSEVTALSYFSEGHNVNDVIMFSDMHFDATGNLVFAANVGSRFALRFLDTTPDAFQELADLPEGGRGMWTPYIVRIAPDLSTVHYGTFAGADLMGPGGSTANSNHGASMRGLQVYGSKLVGDRMYMVGRMNNARVTTAAAVGPYPTIGSTASGSSLYPLVGDEPNNTFRAFLMIYNLASSSVEYFTALPSVNATQVVPTANGRIFIVGDKLLNESLPVGDLLAPLRTHGDGNWLYVIDPAGNGMSDLVQVEFLSDYFDFGQTTRTKLLEHNGRLHYAQHMAVNNVHFGGDTVTYEKLIRMRRINSANLRYVIDPDAVDLVDVLYLGNEGMVYDHCENYWHHYHVQATFDVSPQAYQPFDLWPDRDNRVVVAKQDGLQSIQTLYGGPGVSYTTDGRGDTMAFSEDGSIAYAIGHKHTGSLVGEMPNPAIGDLGNHQGWITAWPTMMYASRNAYACEGIETPVTILDDCVPITTNHTFRWIAPNGLAPGDSIANTNQATVLVNLSVPTKLAMQVWQFGVFVRTFEVDVNLIPNDPTAEELAGPDQYICSGDSTHLDAADLGDHTVWWTPATGLSETNIPNPIASPTVSTEYFYRYTNCQGQLVSDSVWVFVDADAATAVNAGEDQVICRGDTAQIGTPLLGSFTYEWMPVEHLDNPFVAQPLVSGIEADTVFTLMMTDCNGNSATDTVWVLHSLETINAGPDVEVCPGTQVVVGTSFPQPAISNVLWSFVDPLTPGILINSNTLNPTISIAAAGTWEVQVVGQSENCGLSTDVMLIVVTPPPIPNAGLDMVVCVDDPLAPTQYGPLQIGTPGMSSYMVSWAPTLYLDNPTSHMPAVSFPLDMTAPLTYTVSVIDACSGDILTDEVTLTPYTNIPFADAHEREYHETWDPGRDANFSGPDDNEYIIPCCGWWIGQLPRENTHYEWSPSTWLEPIAGRDTIDEAVVRIAVPDCDGITPTWTQLVYTLTATDLCSGQATTSSVTLYPACGTNGVTPMIPDFPICDKGPEEIFICSGESVRIGTEPEISNDWLYVWQPTNGLDDAFHPIPVASPDSDISYALTVINTNIGFSCSDYYVTVRVSPNPLVSAGLPPPAACEGEFIGHQLGPDPAETQYDNPNWIHQWTPATGLDDPTSARPRIIGPPASGYQVIVTDRDTGCRSSAFITIAAGEDFAQPGLNGTICPGQCHSIGSPPSNGFTYAWEPAAGLSSVTNANPLACPETTTVYTLTMTRTNDGCVSFGSVTVDVLEVTTAPADAGVDLGPLCPGGAAVQIGFHASESGVQYLWTAVPSNGLAALSATNIAQPMVDPALLATGQTYTFILEVIDQQTGCASLDSVDVSIAELTPPTVSVTSTNYVRCPGLVFPILQVTTDPNPDQLTFTWSSLDDPTLQYLSDPSNIAPNVIIGETQRMYTLTVSNQCNGLSTNLNLWFTPSSSFTVDVSNLSLCIGQSTQITASVTGGIGPFAFTWTPTHIFDNHTLSNPVVTVHTDTPIFLNVIDQGGFCRTTTTIMATVKNTAANPGEDQSICPGSSVTLGEPAVSGISYQWDVLAGDTNSIPGAGNTAQITVSPTNDTLYQLTVSDTNACAPVTGTVWVTLDTNSLVADAGPDQTNCPWQLVQLGNPGADPNLLYSWSPPINLNDPTAPAPAVYATGTIQYVLTVTDPCSGATATDSVMVVIKPRVDSDHASFYQVCSGGTVMLGPLTPNPDWDYVWQSTFNVDNQNTPNPTYTAPIVTEPTLHELRVRITDHTGTHCPRGYWIQIMVYPEPVLDYPDAVLCAGEAGVQLGTTNSYSGSDQYRFTWFPPDYLDDPTAANPTANPPTSVVYTVTVSDGNSICPQQQQVYVDVQEPVLNALATDGCIGDAAVLSVIPTPGILTWTGPNGFTSTNWTHTLSNLTADDFGDYTATLITPQGCVLSQTVTIYDLCGCDLDMQWIGSSPCVFDNQGNSSSRVDLVLTFGPGSPSDEPVLLRGATTPLLFDTSGGSPLQVSVWIPTSSAPTNYLFASFSNEQYCAAVAGVPFQPPCHPEMDLALQKSLHPFQPLPVGSGHEVSFLVTITNQGNIAASNIVITDYLPPGFVLSPNETNWNSSLSIATYTVPETLLPSERHQTEILLLADSAIAGIYTNWAEISSATNSEYQLGGDDDIDSTPDSTNFNQPGETPDLNDDDVVDQNGKQGGDEDDHDPAVVTIEECNILTAIPIVVCNDQGTGDPSDDTYDLELFVTGTNTTSYRVSGAITATGLVYGITNILVTNLSVFSGDLSLQINDEGPLDCEHHLLIPAPQPCSTCSIAQVLVSTTCNDNGTADPTDDTFSVSLMVTAGGGSTYAVSGDATATGLIYGIPQLVVSSRAIAAGDVILHVSDEAAQGCVSNNIMIAAPAPCSPEASIGDLVWYDEDGDGIQDPEETNGVPNVTVYLKDAGGAIIATTQTDSAGSYLFDGLYPGDYAIQFDLGTLPTGYQVSPQDAGDPTDQVDSDGDPVMGMTETTTLDPGEHDPSWDLGITPRPASIGDLVWYDEDGDGIQDPEETNGVPNVTVYLKDAAGTIIATTQTDSVGSYRFDGLYPGDYAIQFDLSTLPTGYQVSPQDAGDPTDQVDSDGDPVMGMTETTTLDPDEHDPSWDLGINSIEVSLGDYVWKDLNRDGLQTTGEPGVSNITVYLLDATGARLDTTTTDASGFYEFTALPPGTYAVQFDLTSISDDCYPTVPNADGNADDERDSDADPDSGITHTVTLTNEGDHNDTLDMGLVAPLNELGDFVWKDRNANGIQDAGEPGIEGIRVYLLDAGGAQIDQTTTDATGHYLFTQLEAGTYSVRFELADIETGCAPTQPDQGGDDETDSDADPITGQTPPITLPRSDGSHSDLSLDLGVILLDFDLALRKMRAAGQPAAVKAGDFVIFAIEVFNQGDLPARDVVVVDYIPSGLSLADPDWTGNGGMATRTIVGPINPGSSASVTIRLQVDPGVTGGTLINLAEIVSNGDGFVDIDSAGDNDPDNDGAIQDDEIDEDGQDGRDQDDHDIATIQIEARIFDLALRKTLATGQPASVQQGDLVHFTITVYNQGEVEAHDVTLVDYIPEGFELADPDWTDLGSGIATYVIPDPIPAEGSHPVDVTMRVIDGTGDLINFAEIIHASGHQRRRQRQRYRLHLR